MLARLDVPRFLLANNEKCFEFTGKRCIDKFMNFSGLELVDAIIANLRHTDLKKLLDFMRAPFHECT